MKRRPGLARVKRLTTREVLYGRQLKKKDLLIKLCRMCDLLNRWVNFKGKISSHNKVTSVYQRDNLSPKFPARRQKARTESAVLRPLVKPDCYDLWFIKHF